MELEGDRLEIMLTFERIEALRALGRAIKAEEDGCLPNVDATLRRWMESKYPLEAGSTGRQRFMMSTSPPLKAGFLLANGGHHHLRLRS